MGYTYRKYPVEFTTTRNGPNHRLYMVWYDMLKRVTPQSKDCANYFDKGIYVCQEWTYWPNFAAWARANGYAEDLEIDRIDGTKNYEPLNCRFVNETVQSRNVDRLAHRKSCIEAQRKLHGRNIVCVERGRVFTSQSEAAEQTGIAQSSISLALHGKASHAGGFKWKFN